MILRILLWIHTKVGRLRKANLDLFQDLQTDPKLIGDSTSYSQFLQKVNENLAPEHERTGFKPM